MQNQALGFSVNMFCSLESVRALSFICFGPILKPFGSAADKVQHKFIRRDPSTVLTDPAKQMHRLLSHAAN